MDLARIIEIIATDNPAAAEQFLVRLTRHCSLLMKTPKIGRPRPEVGPGIRSLVQGNYLIFYRYVAEQERVDILRVWHGRRRLPRIGRARPTAD